MKLTPIKSLVVYRDLWVRGGNHGTHLLNRHGMCCLGFVGLGIGLPACELQGLGEPDQLEREADDIPHLAYGDDGRAFNSVMTEEAMEINDNEDIDDPERECELTKIFAAADPPIALTFEDTAPPELRAQYEAGLK